MDVGYGGMMRDVGENCLECDLIVGVGVGGGEWRGEGVTWLWLLPVDDMVIW